MTTEAPTRREVQLLLREARRYLAVINTFRAEGCELSWRPEREPAATAKRPLPRLTLGAPPIP